MVIFLFIFLLGPGCYSIDEKIMRWKKS